MNARRYVEAVGRLRYPGRGLVERHAARRRAEARVRAGIPAANERARQQTRVSVSSVTSRWPDGRWERVQWDNGRPARTYRGTTRASRGSRS